MFFDLDGTLWDATESTALAWTDVFSRWGFSDNVTNDQIRSVAGKPYLECLRIIAPEAAACPRIGELLVDLEHAERAKMNEVGGELYPGVLDGLKALSRLTPLFLVSNCNAWYLDAFFEKSGASMLFKDAVCFGNTSMPKHENLLQMIKRYPNSGRFYVGDTQGDKIAAETAGLIYIHATYGFGGDSVVNDLYCDDFEAVCDYLRAQI